MSADNFLMTIPAKDGKIALYDVSMSDMDISIDPEKKHETCAYVASNYKNRFIGVYDDEKALRHAMELYEEDVVVEYGSVFLHRC